MKYINSRKLGIVLFDDRILHYDMANLLDVLGDCRSAGHVTTELACIGRSESLGLKCQNPDDTLLLRNQFAQRS